MNIVSKLLRRAPKHWLPMGIAVAAIAVPAAVMAWGPGRPTYTMAQPADHITFDSITDNPVVGDERNFLTIKDVNEPLNGAWHDTLTAQAGHEYLVRIYVHNDAASNLNLKATNVRAKVNVPTTTGKSIELGGFIDSDNATPAEIWDSATLTSGTDFNVAYEAGTATFFNNVFTNGTKLSDNLVTSAGALLGYNKLDGVIPGCMQFSGYLTFKVKAQGPQTTSFTMSKMVSKHGANQWAKSYTAQPGETVDYLIQYKNTGQTQQDNVVVKDQLPAGETYVAGSSELGNSKTPNGAKISDNVVTGTGVNIGSYAAGANGWVIFSAKIANNDSLSTCGANTLTNNATVETDTGNKSDTATVTTTKTCTTPTPPTPVYECTGLTVDTISRTQFKFTASSKVQNAQLQKYSFVVRDSSGKQIATHDSTDGTFAYTQETVGSYTVTASVVVKVNGQDKTVTSSACQKQFAVTPAPTQNVYICSALTSIEDKTNPNLFTFTVSTEGTKGNVSVKEYHFDFGDNQSITVSAGSETQQHTYAAPGTYQAKVSVTFEVAGKTVTGITSNKCAVSVTVPQPATLTSVTTPSTPGQLPNTSAGIVTGGLFGTGAVGMGINSWLGSRRKVKGSFKR